jgi:hypothetical protein
MWSKNIHPSGRRGKIIPLKKGNLILPITPLCLPKFLQNT